MANVIKTFTFQNAATSTGNGLTYNSIKEDEVLLTVSGTATSFTIVIEASTDNGTTFYPISATNTGTATFVSSITAKDTFYSTPIGGYNRIRCRISAVSGGNITVKGRMIQNV